MKHYIVGIEEISGEKEHTERFLFTISDDADLDEKLRDLWLTWHEDQEEDQVDFFNDSKTSYWSYDSLILKPICSPITKLEFDVMSNHLTNINR